MIKKSIIKKLNVYLRQLKQIWSFTFMTLQLFFYLPFGVTPKRFQHE